MPKKKSLPSRMYDEGKVYVLWGGVYMYVLALVVLFSFTSSAGLKYPKRGSQEEKQ